MIGDTPSHCFTLCLLCCHCNDEDIIALSCGVNELRLTVASAFYVGVADNEMHQNSS